MNILFIGSSSSISEKIQPYLKKEIYTISTKNKKVRNHFYLKNYSNNNLLEIIKKLKKKNISFNNVVFFNGFHERSTLSFFNKKIFNKIIKINVTIPLQMTSDIIKSNMLEKKANVIFIGSIAAELNEIGNAYYSMAKLLLIKSINLLSNEQKKKYRFNIFSLALVRNKMSEKLIKNIPGFFKNKEKFINEKTMIKKFKQLINNKKINNSIIKVHGNYND
jgi:short-subunit dehydrogenase